ncbi:MAG: DUF1648 domain-containing protein [Treponema sp.]|nr:DUF1648 domain-containing protein [Treponema sp.]
MDENIFLFITNLFVYVLCAGLLMIIPQITRKSYLFGVKIPAKEAGCKEAVQMKKRYMAVCLFGAAFLLGFCIIQFLFWREKTLLATLYLPLFIIPLYLAAFIPNWKKAVRLKEERGWTVSDIMYTETQSTHSRGNLSSLPYVWYVLSTIIVFATFLTVVMGYSNLPELIPLHFNSSFEATRMAEKSWWTALQIPLLNIGVLLLMFLVAISIIKVKLQIDPEKPRLSFAQHNVYRKRMGHAIGFITLVISMIIALPTIIIVFPDAAIWTLIGGEAMIWLILIFTFLSIVPVIVIYFITGQGGCKVKIKSEDIDETNIDVSASSKPGRGDDKYWLLGLIYHNPDDPAIVVESRFGSKIGFNLAHLPVKIGAGLLLAGLIALYVALTVTLL